MTHESLVHPQGAQKALSNLTPLSGFEGQTSQKEFIWGVNPRP